MVPFTFEDSKSEILINEFMKGRDFHEVMDMLPVYKGEDIAQEYLDTINEFLENPTEQPPEEFISELRNGFEYLYGKMPEDITASDLVGLTRDDIAERAELLLDDEEELVYE